MVFKEQTFHGLEPEIETEIANRALLESAVANALAIAGGIDAADVEVTMDEDQVVLTGTVGTVGEIERATAVAKAVEGVHSVQNRILLGGSSLDGTH
ncbi:osmotically-inducible protein OsmY [Rhizobium leguminosarum]|uniref:Osmotically-inducible protein OsmY n=1 Tax=Rhizobium leguminosarum TaxID=384 RepID=A0AAE2MMK1_RHILE|nr:MULTISPECIES: BON domain-containing protein [Rhizobium]MBB4291900.1 osmotically-inducible protein OsmY [Rhizobium leguminosarum]MBB4298501.1 osmotically-inducible protein OsmY [Rhizobium leguminosarum]MBB4309639.1 osmotically-inducible protein OsmY [Rhizobium leguminosarum]MBB4419076.1 osmotically-inducible protein OsmY [Rhizobium leguminosarum]MBB4433593.1 osmotically-inducible protein OsmY [Rhizobium esperanzae]